MQEATDYPAVSLDLLKRLDESFPERCPDTTWPERKIWEEVGKRKMVRHLIAIYNIQNQECKFKEVK